MSNKEKGGLNFFDPKIERGPVEFNQMALYLIRLDKRSDERDQALSEGDVIKFFRSTMAIFLNCIPRFKQKGMPDEEIATHKEELLKIGNKVKSFALTNNQAREKNSLIIEEDLFDYNLKLNSLMFQYGLIFPLKDVKPLSEIIEEDY